MDFNLKDYLKKFEQFLPFESRAKTAVIQSVQEVLHITLDRKKIRVQGTQVFIQGSGAMKSELTMKQQKILARIEELQSGLGIQRIS